MSRDACLGLWAIIGIGLAGCSNDSVPSGAGGAAQVGGAGGSSPISESAGGGQATSTSDTGPLRVVSLSAASFAHTCAALSDGTLRCWGVNDNGQLGVAPELAADLCHAVGSDPPLDLRCERTPRVVAGVTDVASVATGSGTTCVLKHDGSVWCWGLNDGGELGIGTASLTPTPTPSRLDLPEVRQLALGAYHGCAVLTDRTVRCWGDNANAQVGVAVAASPSQCDDGDMVTPCVLTPTTVPGLANVERVVPGRNHTCALLVDGTVQCWGLNQFAELGLGHFDQPDQPVEAPAVVALSDVVALGAGNLDTCAVTGDGSVYCWGFDTMGNIGGTPTTTCETPSGSFGCALSPQPISGFANGRTVASGRFHTCFTLADGTARCMGRNDSGQIGVQPTGDVCSLFPDDYPCVRTPSDPGVQGAADITVGNYHSCALLKDGHVRCWGRNEFGQLGDGTTDDRTMAVEVAVP